MGRICIHVQLPMIPWNALRNWGSEVVRDPLPSLSQRKWQMCPVMLPLCHLLFHFFQKYMFNVYYILSIKTEDIYRYTYIHTVVKTDVIFALLKCIAWLIGYEVWQILIKEWHEMCIILKADTYDERNY